MKKCELCESPAKIYCESDQANLCWDCDAEVHGINFIVAKHSRRLLCHVCQSLTPWNGSGTKLGPTISTCESCANNCNQNEARNEKNHNDNGGGGDDDPDGDDDIEDDNDDDDDDDGDGDGEGEIDEDDEENQVVPWSSTPPPPVSSSSTSEECSSRIGEEGLSDSRKTFPWNRMHENAEFHSRK